MYDLDLDDGKPIFLHDTLTHDNTPPHHIWLQKLGRFRRYPMDKNWTDGPTDGQDRWTQ